MIPRLQQFWLLLFPPVERPEQSHSTLERFAIPFTFPPKLTFLEASVAIAGALARIFLGCLLFAVWGSYTLFAWSVIHNLSLRVAAVTGLLVLFLLVLALLLITIAFLTRMVLPKHNRTVIPL